jgi:thioester reductase-like protein
MLSGRGSLTNHIPNTSLADDVSSKESKESLHEKEPHLAPRWRTKIFFISSVGTVSNWASQAPTSRESVPEEELIDWKLARTGYGQSKLLSERLLAHAARTLNIPVDIARVGQLAGPALHGEKGAWPAQEWIPSLIKSSQTLRVLPTSLGPSDIVDWIPVDIAAHVVVDLLQSGSENALASRSMKKARREARFFHIVNPRRTSWSNILPDIRTCLSDATREISIEEWVDCLKSSAKGRDGALKDEIANPALKLMDTFDHIQDRAIRFPDARSAILDTKKTATMSSTLASLEAVNEKWMNLWLRQWGLA